MHFDPTLTIAVVHLAAWGILLTALFGPRGRAVCGFWGALLSAVAPVIGGFLGNKGKKKKEEEAARAQAAQEKADRKRAWEEKVGSPSAEAARMRAALMEGRLLAATGGREKAPSTLLKHYETLRARPTYTEDNLQPTNYGAGGGWDLASQLVGGAGQFAKTYAAEQQRKRQQQQAAQQYDEEQGNVW